MNTHSRKWVALSGLFATLLNTPTLAQVPKSYDVIELGTLPGNVSGPFVGASGFSINSSGKIVGYSYKDEVQGFIAPHGTTFAPNTTPIDLIDSLFPGLNYTGVLYGVNNSGEIVGSVGRDVPQGQVSFQPYIFHPNGTLTTLALPTGATYGSPIKITNTNRILGYSGNNTSGTQYGLWNFDGTRIDLPALQNRTLSDINDAGTAVGYYFQSGATRPFLWNATTGAVDLPFSGSNGYLTSINSAGNLGGFVDNHATLWRNGGTQQIDIHPGFGAQSVVQFKSLTDSGLALVNVSFNDNSTLNCLYDGQKVRTLISMVPTSSPFVKVLTAGITEDGRIVGQGFKTQPASIYQAVASTAVLLVPSSVELPYPTDISASLTSSVTKPRYSPVTKTWAAQITLTNRTNATIVGPFYVSLGGISSFAANFISPKPSGQITNGASTGNSYYTLAGNLAPGASTTLTVYISLGGLTSVQNIAVQAVLAGAGRP